MPIILDDDQSQAKALQTAIKYNPKDYSPVLTGNGVNQGLLKSSLTVVGSDPISQTAVSRIIAERGDCTNKAKHVHDDTHNYTVLCQDISLCGYLEGCKDGTPVPRNIMTDRLATYKDAHGNEKVIRSRLFLNRIYVFKAVSNFVIAAYTLAAYDESDPTASWIVSYDALTATVRPPDPIKDLYERLIRNIDSSMKSWGYQQIKTDWGTLSSDDASRSMYDLIMSELAVIMTPGVLKPTLQAASAADYYKLRSAIDILGLLQLTFDLYQSDVLDVVNSRPPQEAASLKNSNMALSLADTLSSMSGSASNKIPALVGRKYTTQKITLTSEQIAAVESDTMMTIVAAGAGTGKSSCIMHRLQHMEDNGCDMRQTYVLSFTKAAAGHIKKNFKDCKSTTIAEFTHSFINIILDDGSGERVDIIAHSDFVQKLKIRYEDMRTAKILPPNTEAALKEFIRCCENIEHRQSQLLDMLDHNLNPEALNLISILKMMHCTSLELDPIIFHTQLSVLRPNIEHIVVDESQDSNRLEFLSMLKLAMAHNISIYAVGDCAQTLYEFRDADPRILNGLTNLFPTYDLSINHRSTQIILDVANLMSASMTTHKTTLRANSLMSITKQAVDDTVTMDTYEKVTDPDTTKTLDDWLETRLGRGESIAVIARAGRDVQKLYEYLHMRYGAAYDVQNITSQRRNDITILSTIGGSLDSLVPLAANDPTRQKGAAPPLTNYGELARIIRDENIKINANTRGGARYKANGPTVNKVTNDWLADESKDGPQIISRLNSYATRSAEIRRLQLSLLDRQTELNNLLQRVMDAKNAKLKEKKADIVVCTVHGVKGLEYDHVACFINTESGRNSHRTSSDENKRIAYVALTRAKKSECVFCTREKLLKEFQAYRDSQP